VPSREDDELHRGILSRGLPVSVGTDWRGTGK